VIASDIPAHRDLIRLGARGLVLVPPPVRAGRAWHWPEAVERLRGAPPTRVKAPDTSWDETAELLVSRLEAPRAGGAAPRAS